MWMTCIHTIPLQHHGKEPSYHPLHCFHPIWRCVQNHVQHEHRISAQAVLQRRQQYSINNTRASHKQREPSFMSKSRRSNFGHWVPGKMTHSKIAAKPMTAKALHRAKLCQSDEAMTKHWRFRGHDAAKDPSAEEEAWRAWTHQVSAYQTQIGWDFYRFLQMFRMPCR